MYKLGIWGHFEPANKFSVAKPNFVLLNYEWHKPDAWIRGINTEFQLQGTILKYVLYKAFNKSETDYCKNLYTG